MNRHTRRSLAKLSFGALAATLAQFAFRREAVASGSVTVSQLGTYALTAYNAITDAITGVNALGPTVTVPSGLTTALTAVQSAAQALQSVSAGGSQAQQLIQAFDALLPIALPFLAALGPIGGGIALGISAVNALLPEIMSLTNTTPPAGAVIGTPVAAKLPAMTLTRAVSLYGPK